MSYSIFAFICFVSETGASNKYLQISVKVSSLKWIWDASANRHLQCFGWSLCRSIPCLPVHISIPEKIICSYVKIVMSRNVPKTKLYRLRSPATEMFQPSPGPTFLVSIRYCFFSAFSWKEDVLWSKWKAETILPNQEPPVGRQSSWINIQSGLGLPAMDVMQVTLRSQYVKAPSSSIWVSLNLNEFKNNQRCWNCWRDAVDTRKRYFSMGKNRQIPLRDDYQLCSVMYRLDSEKSICQHLCSMLVLEICCSLENG